MKKILALGFLPYWKGGKQTSGLATGIFDLHDAVNSLNGEYKVVMACTDVREEEMDVDSTKVIGWNSSLLIIHSLKRFYRIPYFVSRAYGLKKQYSFPLTNTFVKALFLDYAIEKEQPCAIHFHGATSAFYQELLWDQSLPSILRLHGMNGYNEKVPGYKMYRKKEHDLINLPFSMVTFISKKNQFDWNKFYGSFKCPTEVILNGYNENLFYFREEDRDNAKEFDLITIAAIDKNKGQQRVLEALSKLKKEGKELRYLIVGTGENQYVEGLKHIVDDNKLNVTFYPHCPQKELRKHLLKSRYFILPSAAEGFGKVFVESLACGIPVVLPQNLPIAKEGILNDKNSILMENETSESIYETLKRIESFQLGSALLIASSVKSLSWKGSALQYCKCYGNIGI